MRAPLAFFAALMLVACASTADRPQVPAHAYPHEVRLPADYEARPTDRFPLILFLHGGGGLIPADHLIAEWAASRPDFPFVVVAPRADEQWRADRLERLLDEVVQRYRVDERRVYLTGISRGAFGAFQLAAARPDRFAAVALVAGGGEPERACGIAAIPTWIFHNRNDEVVPVRRSEELVTALRRCGASELHVSIFDAPEPGVWNHNAWRAAYLGPDLYRWFLQHAR